MRATAYNALWRVRAWRVSIFAVVFFTLVGAEAVFVAAAVVASGTSCAILLFMSPFTALYALYWRFFSW